jgi:phytol kinase
VLALLLAASPIIADIPVTLVLLVWMGFVLLLGSRWLYNFVLKKGWDPKRGTYLGRKFVHIFGAGIVAVILPFEFHEPYFPFAFAMMLALLTFTLHRTGRVMYWFQDPANYSETYFALTWGIAVLVTWFFDKTFLLAVVPTLFMAWGDGVTGVVRNIMYKKRTKAWEGSLAMLLVCIPVGMLMGVAGVVAGALSTAVERVEGIDDNISIPIVSLCILIPAWALNLNMPIL